MKVALIVVNYNDHEDTKKYVSKISSYQTIQKIVVVDNKSTENSFEDLKKLESKKVSVISSEKNGGYTYGNNFGINYLKNQNEEYDYYVISNPDIDVEESAILRCINFLSKHEKARNLCS